MSTTRAERIAERLRQAIHAGDYLSGERLVELTLAQQSTVSQNTIRDALRILEAEGWLVKHPRRGAFVRTYGRDEAEELYTLWATLEGLAVGWAAERLSKAELARMRLLIAQAQQLAHQGDMRASMESIFALHRRMAELAGRAQTAALLKTLHNQVRLLENLRQMRVPRNLPQQETHIAAYERMLAAMEAGYAAMAQEVLYELLMADCATLLPILGDGR